MTRNRRASTALKTEGQGRWREPGPGYIANAWHASRRCGAAVEAEQERVAYCFEARTPRQGFGSFQDWLGGCSAGHRAAHGLCFQNPAARIVPLAAVC